MGFLPVIDGEQRALYNEMFDMIRDEYIEGENMFDTKPYEEKINQAFARFEENLRKIRTGRAHPGMLDGVMIEAYGTKMPLNQVANILAPEAQMLQVTPFDPANLKAVVAAIRDDQSLGVNPSDDGRIVRVPVP